MTKKFGLLIARQRSGTGALGTVLDKHSQIKYLGEIFHPNNVGSSNNFFTYKKEAVEKDLSLIEADKAQVLLEGFLDWRQNVIRDQLPIIDIKYNSLHHLTGAWLEPSARPWILSHCVNNQHPIIHLTRENYLQGCVSGRLAEANKVWHARHNDEIKVTEIDLDAGSLVRNFKNTQASVDLMRKWLGKRHFVLEIEYSKMFASDGSLSKEYSADLEDLLDIDVFSDTQPVFIKQNTNALSKSISNFDQVTSVLKDTEFSWMLEA